MTVHVNWVHGFNVGPFTPPDEIGGQVTTDCCHRRRNPDFCELWCFVDGNPYYGSSWFWLCHGDAGCGLGRRSSRFARHPIVPDFECLPDYAEVE